MSCRNFKSACIGRAKPAPSVATQGRISAPIGAMNMNEYLTVREAAEYRRVSEKTIRNYISQGRLDAEKFGPKLLFIHIDSLDRLFTPVLPFKRPRRIGD